MISQILSETKEKMDKALDATKEDFASVRTGRANPACQILVLSQTAMAL